MGINEERVQRQLEIDQMIKSLGDEKHDKGSLRLSQDSGYGETVAGKRFINQAIRGFVEKFNEYTETQYALPATRSVVVKSLTYLDEDKEIGYNLEPGTIGKIVIRSLLRSLVKPEDKRITVTGVAFDIGEAVEFAIKEVQLDEHHAKDKAGLLDMLRRQDRLGEKEEVQMMMNRLSERVNLQHTDFDKKTSGSLGQALLQLFYISKVYKNGEDNGLLFGDLFVEHEESTFQGGSRNTKKSIDISDVGTEWLIENNEFIRDITLSYLPMVIEPQDWTVDHGGYYDQGIYDTYGLIKGYSRKKTARLYEDYPEGFDTLMKTINTIQKTPFRVNETVWQAVNWVHQNEINLERKGIPEYISGYVKYLGEEKADEFFNLKRMLIREETGNLTVDSRTSLLNFVKSVVEGSESLEETDIWKEWATIRKMVIKHARSESSKRILVKNTLEDSQLFLDEDIYFCYNADYRGRIYPLAGQFSPQGSDISRGMLEFANAVTVDPKYDEDAIRQIRIVTANNWGEDKISLDDREMWTAFNTDWIVDCALNFRENKEWMKADKPFLFLQSCLEIAKLVEAIENKSTFKSTMPIAFDGSCNGIQHYSALFLDPMGAKSVNLTKGEVPSDVYQIVANKALDIAKNGTTKVAQLVVQLNEQTSGKLFGRKVAKRSVMTLPYGVSKRSSNIYVHETVDEVLRGVKLTGNDKKAVKKFMGDAIWQGILLVVEKPVTGKEYFQAVAQEMAIWDEGLLWFTPTGFPVTQTLKKRDVKSNLIRVTIEGLTVQRKYPKYLTEIDGGEQANAIAPNFVHSYDSAHLQLSINEGAAEGMTNFLVIHDSFSTDCISAGRFNHIIREQFVNMYSANDWINHFHDTCEAVIDHELLVERQELGNFDINEVLESEYFFA
jgi:DNA-directed RNA polymerase